MTLVNAISWIATIISISTSLVRAANIGYLWHTYIMSSLSSLLLVYHAYSLGSSQLIVLNSFHLLISLFGIYRWTHK